MRVSSTADRVSCVIFETTSESPTFACSAFQGNVHTVEGYRPRIRFAKPCDTTRDGRLAAPALAKKSERLTAIDRERNVVQNDARTAGPVFRSVRGTQTAHFQNGHRTMRESSTSSSAGSPARHASFTWGQRGWNVHPPGSCSACTGSPCITCASLSD